jgi:oligopeptide/dipeptide ABC transporter ATP-binding protein
MSLLEVEGLTVSYATPAGPLRAVDGVSFTVGEGETVGLVGESGCGKSSLGRAILRLEPSARGRVMLEGEDMLGATGAALARLRGRAQMVFQDPYGSLNPRRTVGDSIGQPLRLAGRSRAEAAARTAALLGDVGLDAGVAGRYPHEFSGGQRQRIGIARALALSPRLIVCDEPVSALDVSVRAQVLNLLVALQRRHGMAYLFVSHDLSIVEHVCDRVLVMYLGRIVESAPRERIWRRPAHPYTRALLEAAPVADPGRARAARARLLPGELPSPLNPPGGCAFHPRCALAREMCRREAPVLREVAPGQVAACHFAEEAENVA